jgi:3-mercaptopyruvate sulfurtransferase SseA
LQHQVVRDYIDKDAFGRLIGSKGIGQDQTVVFYGDRNNWWACYAFWVFKMYGELLHMPDYPQEGALRGGHIPGAASVPWGQAVAPDSTFKSMDELRALYEGKAGLMPTDEVITYCRIGERSSHTWFVLTYLLGYPSVRNYDGSWTEWGNLVGAPIERSV